VGGRIRFTNVLFFIVAQPQGVFMKVTVVENSNPTYAANQLTSMYGRTFFRPGVANEYYLVDGTGNIVRINASGASPVYIPSYGPINSGVPYATYSEYKGELKLTITTP